MQDIRGIEVKAGDICHIVANDGQTDILATAVRTKGRGVKFVTDDDKTLTKDDLVSMGAQVIIQTSSLPTKPCVQVTSEEINLIEKLQSLGWKGSLMKEVTSIRYQITLN